MGAARDTFDRIYDSDADWSNTVNPILEQLDFHPLSIALFVTVAHQNKWDMSRLTREWAKRRTSVLHTQQNDSLAATIELSPPPLCSNNLAPMPERSLESSHFSHRASTRTTSSGCFQPSRTEPPSLTGFAFYGFVTMLAPLRDYLSPNDPKTSPLLCTTKEHYFTRMPVVIDPDIPNFGETQWITSEDVNVEHLLDVFTTIDVNSDGIWRTRINFMIHLH